MAKNDFDIDFDFEKEYGFDPDAMGSEYTEDDFDLSGLEEDLSQEETAQAEDDFSDFDLDGLDLSDIARNGYGELSRRVDLSGEDFCNCLTTKHSRLPGFDYGIDVLLCPYQTQRPAV